MPRISSRAPRSRLAHGMSRPAPPLFLDRFHRPFSLPFPLAAFFLLRAALALRGVGAAIRFRHPPLGRLHFFFSLLPPSAPKSCSFPSLRRRPAAGAVVHPSTGCSFGRRPVDRRLVSPPAPPPPLCSRPCRYAPSPPLLVSRSVLQTSQTLSPFSESRTASSAPLSACQRPPAPAPSQSLPRVLPPLSVRVLLIWFAARSTHRVRERDWAWKIAGLSSVLARIGEAQRRAGGRGKRGAKRARHAKGSGGKRGEGRKARRARKGKWGEEGSRRATRAGREGFSRG